ncbi:hypothetical protein [Polymorphospora sp. NPDC050346]|uniref:hypothetical protein n=1 Tax=Polymorphospora sp. NPDC050346 TaxID=3155780 RepID=UPI0033C7B1C1
MLASRVGPEHHVRWKLPKDQQRLLPPGPVRASPSPGVRAAADIVLAERDRGPQRPDVG